MIEISHLVTNQLCGLDKVQVKVVQSFLTLCDPMDYMAHGIL